MALDPKYIADASLCELFRDKDTGLPLRFGYILFYKDNARQIGKPVYKLVGSPPNYTYTEYGQAWLDPMGNLAWRVDLNAQGYLDYALYYYPYDDTGNTVELYFVKVYSSDNVVINPTSILQFSREAWPPDVTASSVTGTVIDINYVPDGQFLTHEDLPKTSVYEAGEIRAPITNINYGGWTFERPNSTTAKDFVTFERFGSFVTTPNSNPRYACRVKCEQPNAGDGFKDLRLRFNDVNKFNTTEVGKVFTFAFYGVSNSGGGVNASLILYKNYGTGGSTPTETSITNFTITTSYNQYYVSFSFGDNSGKTLGALNDDYLQLVLRLPVDSIFDASFTDVLLTPDNVLSPIFPDQPNNQFLYRAISGFTNIPAYDASDVYLPLRLTPTGLEFDSSEIGSIIYTILPTPKIGQLLCNGAQYETAAYSSDGIPYSRLQKVLFNSTFNIPLFGTGDEYVTSQPVDALTNILRISTNKVAPVGAITDGATPTNFTFFPIFVSSINHDVDGPYLGNNTLYIRNTFINPVTASSAGTSGFTVTQIRQGSAQLREITQVTTIAATTLAGKYFTFANATQWYMWFTVDGVGADPAPGGTGIKVDLKSTFTADEVARIVSLAAYGYDVTDVTMSAGNIIAAGSYFNIFTATQNYYVWYKVNGVGTDPAPVSALPIEVDILSTDTAAQVVTKTQIAINSKYFAVPNCTDIFFRVFNPSSTALRFSDNPLIYGAQIGTFQLDNVIEHAHGIPNSNGGGGIDGFIVDQFVGYTDTTSTGGGENTPPNMYVNCVIKY